MRATYDVAARPLWMEPAATRITLIASHQDQVVALPEGAELLARASDGGCPVAGFTVGTRAWTLQPHPEFVPPMADHLLAGRIELIGAERVRVAARCLTARWIVRAFVPWIANFFAGTTRT